MLDVYADFAEQYMAMPVIKGEKTEGERFPGAVATYSIEALMQDNKALQAGTSHFLGQNFAKAQEIKFQNQEGQEVYAWTTSWGVSTRLVGGLIMTHSDDDGLVLPPKLAPAHVVIMPIYKTDEERAEVLAYCESLKADLIAQRYDDEPVRVRIDDRDIRGGGKKWQWVKRGVPLRVEVGPRDVAGGGVCFWRGAMSVAKGRAPRGKNSLRMWPAPWSKSNKLFSIVRPGNAKTCRCRLIRSREFEKFFAEGSPGGLAYCHFVDGPEMEAKLKSLKVTARCVPIAGRRRTGGVYFLRRHEHPSRRFRAGLLM